MATIRSSNRDVTATSLAGITNWPGGDLGFTTSGVRGGTTVEAMPTSFLYSRSDGRGNSTFTSGTGVDLVYDANNIPISGTIISLTIGGTAGGSGAGGPGRFNRLTIEDINLSIAEVRDPDFLENVLSGNDSILLDRVNSGFLIGNKTIEAGDGDDVIQQNNEGVDFNFLNTTSRSPVITDAGPGSDRVLLEAESFDETIRLGSGVDAVVLNSYATPPQNTPNRVVLDFNPAEDRVELLPFADGSRNYEIVDFEGNAVIRSFAVNNPSDIRDALVLENVESANLQILGGVVQASESFVAPQIEFGTDESDVLLGDRFTNIINSLGGDDVIISYESNDVLIGGEGADSIDAGAGQDELFGGIGEDRLFGGADSDVLFGGDGNDFLIGDNEAGSGNDGIFGGSGDDIAFGGFGEDYIEGNEGNDDLNGEQGNDQILGGNGHDIITGAEGSDELFGEAGDDIIFGEKGEFLGPTSNDKIFGGAGNDILDGGFGNDTIFGGTGNDTLFAGVGITGDVLFGESGNDVIRGGLGSDYIVAGEGTDIVSGDQGRDFVKLETGSGLNFWQDFQDGLDRFDASFDSGAREKIQIFSTLDNSGTWIGYADTQWILEGVDASLIDDADFLHAEDSAG